MRPQLRLGEKFLEVRNWTTATKIPYECIARLDASDGLRVHLKDGGSVRCRIAGKSLAGQLARYPSAKLVRRAVQPLISPAEPSNELVLERKISFSLKVLGALLSVHIIWFLILKFALGVT